MPKKEHKNLEVRPPVVGIFGHIDHGKSTLLSYIRKSKAPLNEAGGITQHVSAYEVEHLGKDGKVHKITFIDTPGHEAFFGIRKRGAQVADIAVLVVSAEDGVKPQTKEALSAITDSKTPYIVAINKIDKPEANIEFTKQSLAEAGVYVEGYGGDIPWVSVSAKSGEGVNDLLELIILVAELESLTGDSQMLGEGYVLESNRDVRKGISATCIVKNGMVEKGMFAASGISWSPIRMMENFLGKPIDLATIGSPVKIIGWDSLPEVGNEFKIFKTRDEAKEYIEKINLNKKSKAVVETNTSEIAMLPLIVKADTGSSLEAVTLQIQKLGNERIKPRILSSSIGTISENDIRLADGKEKATVIGFHAKVDSLAQNLSQRNEIRIETFDIIYKMTEWLSEELERQTPKVKVSEQTGLAKVLKIFSKVKDKQILGGRVEKGDIALGAQVKIFRRDVEIGEGRVKELQEQKVTTKSVAEGREFGALIEAKMEIAPGDKIESFIIVEK